MDAKTMTMVDVLEAGARRAGASVQLGGKRATHQLTCKGKDIVVKAAVRSGRRMSLRRCVLNGRIEGDSVVVDAPLEVVTAEGTARPVLLEEIAPVVTELVAALVTAEDVRVERDDFVRELEARPGPLHRKDAGMHVFPSSGMPGWEVLATPGCTIYGEAVVSLTITYRPADAKCPGVNGTDHGTVVVARCDVVNAVTLNSILDALM